MRHYRRQVIYLVIAECHNGDENYVIDSAWLSERKAQKCCDALNYDQARLEECGLFPYEIIPKIIHK